MSAETELFLGQVYGQALLFGLLALGIFSIIKFIVKDHKMQKNLRGALQGRAEAISKAILRNGLGDSWCYAGKSKKRIEVYKRRRLVAIYDIHFRSKGVIFTDAATGERIGRKLEQVPLQTLVDEFVKEIMDSLGQAKAIDEEILKNGSVTINAAVFNNGRPLLPREVQALEKALNFVGNYEILMIDYETGQMCLSLAG